METKRVIIDADPATGVRFRDVDDGLAILLLYSSPNIKLEGITVNFGNVSADRGFKVAREVLDLVGAPTPVFKGAKSKKELGVLNPAVEFMIETVNANPGEISLLAVAPLTNVATAMMLDKNFASNLGELVVMGGSINFKPFSYFGEFNFHMDGRAASAVMSAPVIKTLITMDLCSQAVFKKEHLAKIKEHHTPAARFLSKTIAHWLRLNRLIFLRSGGFFPWDVVAAAYVMQSSLFDNNPYCLTIQEVGLRSGRIDRLTPWGECETADGCTSVNIPRKLNKESFFNIFIDGLLCL